MRRTEIGEGRREKVAPSLPGLEFGGTLARVLGSRLSDEERGLWSRKVFSFFKSEPPLSLLQGHFKPHFAHFCAAVCLVVVGGGGGPLLYASSEDFF